ncbi:MAG: DUF3999 domain-containing protein [Desulfobulbaceae bacterium]|nr:DUF3999 domain-containing protein [Desulfobulbaceae bacterium]
MTRFIFGSLFFCLISLRGAIGLGATFDERLWEKYADIEMSAAKNNGDLAAVYLEPQQFGDLADNGSFADLRVVSDRKEEVPWQIVSRRPERRTEVLPTQIRNLSSTDKGETWLELLVDGQETAANAVEIVTPTTDFTRQVEVLGSVDAKTWNTLRKDGVIFDINRGEKLHHTSITFPQASFRHLALKITNGDALPLTISAVKVTQESVSPEQTYSVYGVTGKTEVDVSRQENSIVVRMNTVFPLDRLTIDTAERNFQRLVEVQVKRGAGDWERWVQGSIFSLDTETMHEAQLSINMPEVATKEFRLIFKNLDSPPLPVKNVVGSGYRRLLVFKQSSDKKLYLFWGNPMAQLPHYDLAELIAKEKLDGVPVARLGEVRPNTKFAGNDARLPFSERYKYLLYAVVVMAIAGLVLLQYRVFSRVET